MLVLSRKVGQELVIGDNIRITINRVGGSRVTLGISAPDDVRIVRAELTPIVTAFEDSSEPARTGGAETGEDLEEADPVACHSAWSLEGPSSLLDLAPPVR